jgi:hypothetical protein
LPPRRASEQDPAMRIAIRTMTGLLVLLPAVMLSACGSGGGEPAAISAATQPGQEYVVGFGETIHVAGLSLEFTTLAGESRCPTSVVCVWEGNARVLVTATRGSATSVLELNSNRQFPFRAVFENTMIELRRVDPYPVTPAPPRAEDYTVTLFVEFARLE